MYGFGQRDTAQVFKAACDEPGAEEACGGRPVERRPYGVNHEVVMWA